MVEVYEAFDAIRKFLDTGGDVLYMIMIVTFLMWVLIIERLWYFRAAFKTEAKKVVTAWEARSERKSWHAHKIRVAMVSQVKQDLHTGVVTIKTLVGICPLVGLLGTVTGMIEVFDVMATMGSGNARAMASGVSKATIPTMAGMVAALSGVFMRTYIERKAKRESEKLEDSLTIDY